MLSHSAIKIVSILLLASVLTEVEGNAVHRRTRSRGNLDGRDLGIGGFQGRADSDSTGKGKSGSKGKGKSGTKGKGKSGSKGKGGKGKGEAVEGRHHGSIATKKPTSNPTLSPTIFVNENARVPVPDIRPVPPPVPPPVTAGPPIPATAFNPSFWFPAANTETEEEPDSETTEGRVENPSVDGSNGNGNSNEDSQTVIDVNGGGSSNQDQNGGDEKDDKKELSDAFKEIFGDINGDDSEGGSSNGAGNDDNAGDSSAEDTNNGINGGGISDGSGGQGGGTSGENSDANTGSGTSNGTGNGGSNAEGSGSQNNGGNGGTGTGGSGSQNNGGNGGANTGGSGSQNNGGNGGANTGGSGSQNNGGNGGGSGSQNNGGNGGANADGSEPQSNGGNGNINVVTDNSNGSGNQGSGSGNQNNGSGGENNSNGSGNQGSGSGNQNNSNGSGNQGSGSENQNNGSGGQNNGSGNQNNSSGSQNNAGNGGSSNGGSTSDGSTTQNNGENGNANGGDNPSNGNNNGDSSGANGNNEVISQDGSATQAGGNSQNGSNNGNGNGGNGSGNSESSEGGTEINTEEGDATEDDYVGNTATALFCPEISADKEVLVNWIYAVEFEPNMTDKEMASSIAVMEMKLVSELLDCTPAVLPGKRNIRHRQLFQEGIAGLNPMPLDAKNDNVVCFSNSTSGGACQTYYGRMEMYLQNNTDESIAINNMLYAIRDTMQRNDFPDIEGIIQVWYLEPDLSDVAGISDTGGTTPDPQINDGAFSTGTMMAFAALGIFVFAAIVLGAFRMRRNENDTITNFEHSTMAGSAMTTANDSFGTKQQSTLSAILPSSYRLDDADAMSAIPEGDDDSDSRYNCSIIMSEGGYTSDGDSIRDAPLFPETADPVLGARGMDDDDMKTDNDLLFENTQTIDEIMGGCIPEGDFSDHRKRTLVHSSQVGLGVKHSAVDVHQCTSARCNICNYKPKDVEFIHKSPNSPDVSTGRFFNEMDEVNDEC